MERLTTLGDAVRARRAELGLRQSELAELAGCSQRFVHTVEQGKPSLRMDKLLDVLGVLGLGLELVPGRGEVRTRPVGPDPAGPSTGADLDSRSAYPGFAQQAHEQSVAVAGGATADQAFVDAASDLGDG